MVDATKVLAIIPARGGSKSIPRKNIKLLKGVPLIAHSIAAALNAQSVDRVIVSTDDEEIAGIARLWGAQVPFIRPKELAEDDTPDLPVFEHALKWLKDYENYIPDVIVQIRPTSPFRPKDLIDRAVEMLLADKKADSVRSIVSSNQNPYKMWSISEKGYMDPLLKLSGVAEAYNQLRQKLPVTYWQTGHVDVMRFKTLQKSSMSGKKILPLILKPVYAIDIDTEADWNQAEWIMDRFKLSIIKPG